MTDTEAKALGLVNVHAINRRSDLGDAKHTELRCALLDAVQAQAATEARHAAELREQAERFEAFRQEVSDAIESCMLGPIAEERLTPFILPKPDPLEDVLSEAGYAVFPDDLERVRAALAARGYEIRKIGRTPPSGGSDAE